MRRLLLLLTQCVLIVAIACATAWAWLTFTAAPHLTLGSVIGCAFAAALLTLLVEAAVRQVRRGRPRRAHARPRHTERTRP
ncbi:hypothetical protein [Streptomyces sp. NPDC058985]|uniref:hypothetical protein n=1 Tax=Streptomyces sp. NPDC058985 TaxID=3346684 RepID=UPI0036747ACD